MADQEWPHPRKKPREPAHWKVAVKHGHGYASIMPADVHDEGVGLVVPWEAHVGDVLDLVVTTGNRVYQLPGLVKWTQAADGGTRCGVELSPEHPEDARAVYEAIR